MSVSNNASTEAANAAPTAPAISIRPKRTKQPSLRFGLPKSAVVSATTTCEAGEKLAVTAGASDLDHTMDEDSCSEGGDDIITGLPISKTKKKRVIADDSSSSDSSSASDSDVAIKASTKKAEKTKRTTKKKKGELSSTHPKTPPVTTLAAKVK